MASTRRHDFVELDHATIAELARPALGARRIVAAAPLANGFINTNYKLVLDNGAALVLRLFLRDPLACQKEADLWALAHERVPMPEVLWSDPTGGAFGTPYAITRFVDGVLLQQVLREGSAADRRAAMQAVGATLAWLSEYTFPASGFFGPGLAVRQPFGDSRSATVGYIEQALLHGRAGERLGVTFRDRLWRFVSDNAPVLDDVPPIPALVHADYQATNLLLRHDGAAWQTAAVLDWEWALASTPLFDIGIMLRASTGGDPALRTAFVDAFAAAGGELPAAWQRITGLLDLINLLEFLNDPTERIAVPPIAELIEKTIDDRR